MYGKPCRIDQLYGNHVGKVFRTAVPVQSDFLFACYSDPIYRSVVAHTPDAAVIIPPRSTAVPSDTAETAPTQRDRHIQLIEQRGRLGWQRAVNYGTRIRGFRAIKGL